MIVSEKYVKEYHNIENIYDPHFQEYEGKIIRNKCSTNEFCWV